VRLDDVCCRPHETEAECAQARAPITGHAWRRDRGIWRGALTVARSNGGKRLFDVTVAGSLLLLLSPVLLGMALAVRLSMGPPVLYRQVRPGLHAEPFAIYKFRTMRTEETDAQGRILEDAERETKLGVRLRSLSLDELPELWNVVKGDMSLVGPRPLLMQYLPRYSAEQARRHEVRPGITGLAQISGRNAISWDQKFELDVKYVDEHDLRMDIDILLRTIRTVVSREGVLTEDQEYVSEFLGPETSKTASGPGDEGGAIR
jgi:lipopolysaccharide/colanic/teichoic acid biosynthesis glycosyltransferase